MPNPDATQPSSQSAEDLERVLAEIDKLVLEVQEARRTAHAPEDSERDLGLGVMQYWHAIRAALAREREALREALRELLKSGAHDAPCDNEDAPDEACELHLKAYAERHERAKALLAQPAAWEERERG